jgi:hypothetical protein
MPALNSPTLTQDHQNALETIIIDLVKRNKGIRQNELLLLTMGSVDCASPEWLITTIDDMVCHGRLIGVDYACEDERNLLLFPASTKVMVSLPIRIVINETRH